MRICLILALSLFGLLLVGAQPLNKGGVKGGEIRTEAPLPTEKQGVKGGEIRTEAPLPTERPTQRQDQGSNKGGVKGGEIRTEAPLPTERPTQRQEQGHKGAKGGEIRTEVPLPTERPTERREQGSNKGGVKGGEIRTEVPLPTERPTERREQGSSKGGVKGGEEVVPVTSRPCLLDIDDFSRMLFAGIDMFATQNLFGLNTGTDDTMGVKYDIQNRTVTLEVWGEKSYWYTFLGSASCFDLRNYHALRFVLRDEVVDPRDMRVGIQLGKGEGCLRDLTYFASWDSAVKSFDQVNRNYIYEFPFDKFLGLKELDSILAIELSGFSRRQIHMKMEISHLQLVGSECALREVLPTSGNLGGSQVNTKEVKGKGQSA